MQIDTTQELINDITRLSQSSDEVLNKKINSLVQIYEEQIKINEKLKKENNFFIQKFDKRNTLNDDKKDKIIEQQSRLASLGEMIDAVAHQWKQPLNAISMMVDMLQGDFLEKSVDDKYIDDLQSSVHMQIDHMVTTLNEFRDFLRPSTSSENFHVHTIIKNVQVLMKDELIAQNIHLNLDIDSSIIVFGNKNEFKHLFINFINNSIDAFNEHKLNSRKIYIRCFCKNKDIVIEIEDNAGGIPTHIIDHIFKQNITTKANGKGTGIGLYMCSQIVTKNNGTMHVENRNDGVLFRIVLRESSI